LEKRFGKKHPKLESFAEPLPPYRWLATAFFRLHRRRQFGQHGYQPLSYQEMADYGERVLKLVPSQFSLYYLTMEETDNAILYDHFKKTEPPAEDAEGKSKRNRMPKAGRKG
jgi:hypothetical protein